MALFNSISSLLTIKSRWSGAIFLGLGIMVGVIGFVGFHFIFMKGTDSIELCVSCHEMDGVYAEYQKSSHYKNNSGVRTRCVDCHVPHGDTFGDYYAKFLDKVFVGSRHLYHHVIGTYPDGAAFDKARYRLAQNVLESMRKRDSKECRQCHSYEAMELLDQGKSAARKHGKMMQGGDKTCIDCHSGIVHEEPEKPEETDESEE